MCHKEESQKQSAAFLAAAVAAPLAQTASGCTWLAAAPVTLACLLLGWTVNRRAGEDRRWLKELQGLWNCVILASILSWSGKCWPQLEGGWAIPYVLLALAAWASASRHRAQRGGCFLLWPMALLLGAVLISGMGDVQWENLRPSWQMPDVWLIPIALLPALNRTKASGGKLWWAIEGYALAAAAVTAGVLSPAVSVREISPIYELSRSIRLLGVAPRFESLMAAAMTMGYFVTACYLLTNGGESAMGGKRAWSYAVLTGILLGTGFRVDSRLGAMGSLLFWVVLPALAWLKKNPKKMEKPS